jgi:hypothetical protein
VGNGDGRDSGRDVSCLRPPMLIRAGLNKLLDERGRQLGR